MRRLTALTAVALVVGVSLGTAAAPVPLQMTAADWDMSAQATVLSRAVDRETAAILAGTRAELQARLAQAVTDAQTVLDSSADRVPDGDETRTTLASAIADAQAVDTDAGDVSALRDTVASHEASLTEATDAVTAAVQAQADAEARAAEEAAAREAEAQVAQTDQTDQTRTEAETASTPGRTWREVAEGIAAEWGVSVRWTDAQTCGWRPGAWSPTSVTITGCVNETEQTIQLSTAGMGADFDHDRPAAQRILSDTARHEIAHVLIGRKCGTPNPPIADVRYENVTDAYSVMFVGATSAPGYGFTDADAAIAQAIHDGRCS
jgi:hypothetical protein